MQAARARARVHRLGSLTIDESAFELSLDGAPLSVQPLVFEVLLFFVQNENRLVAKDELLGGPWRGACVGDASLYRCVMLVRKLLARASGGARIVTVRGRGFRFSHRPASVAVEAAPECE